MSKEKGFSIGSIVAIFLGSIVGLSLTATIVSLVDSASSPMSAGATKSLIELFPLFWVIFLTAIPVGSIALFLMEKAKTGDIGIGDIIGVFLPSVVGLSLTSTVYYTVANATVNMSAGATKTMLELFPMFWVIYLIGIPVSAIAVFFYVKQKG